MDSSDIYKKYLDSALHFLSYRPRSEKEVRDNLTKKNAPQEIIDRIISRLKAHRFINDEEFASWWIEQRSKFRPRALRIIKLELLQKGITKEIIDNLFQKQKSGNLNQVELAKKLLEKKIAKYSGLEKREVYQKLGAYLARKGFDWDTIKKSIDDSMLEI